MTKTERLYRSRLQAIVAAKVLADMAGVDPCPDHGAHSPGCTTCADMLADVRRQYPGPVSSVAAIACACFPRTNGLPHNSRTSAVASRRLEREMGTDPSDRTSDGLKWETLDAICAGLGCTRGDLLG